MFGTGFTPILAYFGLFDPVLACFEGYLGGAVNLTGSPLTWFGPYFGLFGLFDRFGPISPKRR